MSAVAPSAAPRSGHLFLDFFYRLRAYRVPATTHNWLALMKALGKGLHGDSLDGFYRVARCLLVASEAHYDAFDAAFGETFRGVEADLEKLLEHLDEWLADPAKLEGLDPELAAKLRELGIDELRRQLEERLAEQKERHQGGSKWIGTGGTSPFGQGGFHPSGVRLGGEGGGRSALAVADARRFRGFRRDLVLDTRQIAGALRRLRKLTRQGVDDELDLEGTIDETARNCGDLEIVLRPPRKNEIRLLLLLDVGGSMDPHSHLVSRLFSAAHQSGGFRELRSYYFHNCVYGKVFEDARFRRSLPLDDLLATLDSRWYLVFVGDAWMHPGELTLSSGDFWSPNPGPTGLSRLARLADRFPHAAWLNPVPPRAWGAPSIAEIARLYAMFPLTLEGLDDMVEHLRRSPSTERLEWARRVIREMG